MPANIQHGQHQAKNQENRCGIFSHFREGVPAAGAEQRVTGAAAERQARARLLLRQLHQNQQYQQQARHR